MSWPEDMDDSVVEVVVLQLKWLEDDRRLQARLRAGDW